MKIACKIGIHWWETEIFYANLRMEGRNKILKLKYLIRTCEKCGKQQEMNLNGQKFTEKYWRDPICLNNCVDENQKIRLLRKSQIIKLGLSR